ncbi:MAG TPA: tripartite tricarboxylate transporter substrate binding protein [Xanthobacteraceae bacterium]|nr:tripartite tricarboxylate transporter substrate binding protein [Xanthobacteraceae bacterium]
MTRRLAWFAVALVLLTAVLGRGAPAQDYPVRPITIVVPFPPGGGVDVLARVVGERLATAMKAQVIVDNRGGAGGTLGTRSVAKAEPDGHTLLLGHTGTMSINPTLYANPGYDPRKDFAPIGLIASMQVALIAHPSFPPRTVAEFIAYAKKESGKVNIGTSAIGTGSYLCAELFKSMAGLNVTLVPYRGTAALMNDLLGGHVPIAFGVLPPALGNLQAGKLRAIAVSGAKRFSQLPEVPTVAESGLPGFEAVLHYGLLAPAGTPKPIIARLNKELRAAVDSDEVKKRIHAEGGDPLASSPEEYAADIDREERKWAALIKKLNLKVQ